MYGILGISRLLESRELLHVVYEIYNTWAAAFCLFFQAEDGIRDYKVTGVQTCALPIFPIDVIALAAGRQRYAFFTNADGGILDDLMIAHCGDHLFLVVNASRSAADEAHLRAALSPICIVEVLENRALLALQGPAAEDVLVRLAPDIAAMRFMDVRVLTITGSEC